ncbi:MAG: DUF5017 domain-containing protein [Bacteroidales bacterium]|nr:DUF5017 domain-containing protein [Bacteroidales bacterium]
MKHSYFKIISFCLIFLWGSMAGRSQALLVEDFDYVIGDLLTAHGWTAHSGAGTQAIDVTTGLTFSGYAGSGIGGAANLDNNGEDDHKVFTGQTSGVVYAAFVIQTQATNSAGYFFHLSVNPINTSFFISRIWVNATGSGVGIGASAPGTYIPITAATPTLLVVKHDLSTKISSLFVFNTFPASEPGTADATFTETYASITNVGSVAVRQFNAAEKVIVDGIRVGTTWADAVAPSGPSAPTVSTEEPTNMATTSCTGNGTITSTGNSTVTTRGFCWDLAANADPDINDAKTVETGSFDVGAFTASVTSLLPNTSYKIRAYATNSVGTSYGGVISFTTIPLTPFIAVDPSQLDGFNYSQGSGPSAQQSFAINGANLTAPISIVPPTHYEISTQSGGSFVATNPITLNHTGGTVNSTPIYVRLKAGLNAGDYNNEMINATSTNATPVTVTCNGSVSLPATQLAFVNFPAICHINTPISTFTVEARRSDNTVDVNYTGNITLSKASGPGTVGGTLVKAAVAGVATFDDITLNTVGSYVLNANAAGLTQAVSGSIYAVNDPTMTEVLVPQFIEGLNGTNNDRVPFAYRATINGLIPNATYRFINQLVISTDSPTTNGAGNVIFVNPDGTFVRTTQPSLDAGPYGQFTANASGSFTGWFVNEPTANARFTPGNQIYMRIRLNDGATGTTAAYYVTTTSYSTVLNFTQQPDDISGTAIRCESNATAKNFVFLFQNTAGTGRPLYGTHVETTEIDFTAIDAYSDFYQNIVAGVTGSWGGIVPNNNPQGVKLIQERSLTTGEIVNSNTSANAVWNGVNTANPAGGTVSPLVILLNASTDPQIIATPSELTDLNYLDGSGPSVSQSYDLMGLYLNPGQVTVTAPASFEISTDDATFGSNLVFNIVEGNIEFQPLTIYVRLKAGLAIGSYNENISHTGGTAPEELVSCSGTVIGPQTTTLPYAEDFASGFGLCYQNSVSGADKYWLHSSTGEYAYMNGYNTGDLEEDWLILPAVNFNDYANVTMTFESWMRYGIDDADNYFKVMYSTDYAGIGDPTSANWTELTFAYPAAEETWTPSGTIDLSAVTGTNVYIAFKYHYNVDFYRLWQVDNLSIVAGSTSPTITATPSTLNNFTYIEGFGPSASQTYTLSANNLVGSGDINVTSPVDYEISSDNTIFGNSLSFPFADGNITGQPVTVYVRLKAGLTAGLFEGETISHTGGDATETFVTLNGEVTLQGTATLSSQVLPQYIEGLNDANNDRIPFAFRATLSGLNPNATYRYINQVVINSDDAETNGAGNMIIAKLDGDFIRTTSPAFDTEGNYGELTTDVSGSYTGWFVTEPTGNARFTPGNFVFMRIRLNDGNEGTTVSHYLTTSDSTKVLTFGVETNENQGTALRAISGDSPKDFVFLYDNLAGEGRPLYGASIEASGIDFTAITSYAPFFKDFVAGVNGSWGAIIPNVNANGVQLIQVLDLSSGAVEKSYTGAGGVWGATETINPVGGTANVLVIDLIEIGINTNDEVACRVWANNSELIVESTTDTRLNIQIYTMLGQPVFMKEVGGVGTQRMFHYLNSGVYIVNVKTDHGITNSKIIIR